MTTDIVRAQKLEDARRMRELRKQGLTLRQIGDRFRLSESAVCRILSGNRRVPPAQTATRRTLAWLGLVAFPLGYLGVWKLPEGWQQALCGVASGAGLAAAVAFVLDAGQKREGD